jgi:hypothetical protein
MLFGSIRVKKYCGFDKVTFGDVLLALALLSAIGVILYYANWRQIAVGYLILLGLFLFGLWRGRVP